MNPTNKESKAFTGKVAVVTASITGIGNAILKKLAQNGATTYLAAHLKDDSMQVVNELREQGLDVKYVRFDGFDNTTHRAMIEEVVKNEGKIDILVNNFGLTDPKKDLDLITGDTDTFFKTVNSNLESVYLTSKAALPHMIKQGDGRIVNISSIGSVVPDLGRLGYMVSKAAINSLTQNIAFMYARFGIRCNSIMPGMTATPAVVNALSEEYSKMYLSHTTAGRIAQPEEMANAVYFLVSDESSYINGEIINMAGGFGTGTPLYADYLNGKSIG